MRFDSKSRESGWEPFMDWMTAQGLDPSVAQSLDIDEEAMTATIVEYDLNEQGDKYAVGNELALKPPRTVPVDSLPPRRTQ